MVAYLRRAMRKQFHPQSRRALSRCGSEAASTGMYMRAHASIHRHDRLLVQCVEHVGEMIATRSLEDISVACCDHSSHDREIGGAQREVDFARNAAADQLLQRSFVSLLYGHLISNVLAGCLQQTDVFDLRWKFV
jgi:hypothetical protein